MARTESSIPDSFEHFRVLVADDERTIADSVSKLMHRRFGAQFFSVYDGHGVIAFLEKYPVDLVITDMQMPGPHGVELVKQLTQRWPGMPIIVMTAYPLDFPYVDVIMNGAADFIVKPHHPEEMEAKILRIFREITLKNEHARQREKILQDLEELKRARAAQALAEEKYRSLFEYSMNGMLLMNPDTLEIYEANKAFCSLIGRSRGAVRYLPFNEMLDDPHRSRFESALEHFRTTTHGTLADIQIVNEQGKALLLDVSVSFIKLDSETLLMVMFKDVTEQREMQQQISELASTDSLTGLLNQRMFYMRLEAAMARSRRSNESLTLMFLDLDDFKQCNDTHGHQAGDTLLRAVGEVIRKHIRTGRDLGFRYGGDEFAILLSGAPLEAAVRVGERIRKEFDNTKTFGTSMSIGLAQYQEGKSGDALVKTADAALYEAKAAGKNAVRSG